jgi:excinuclease ABC subunit A
VFSPIRDLFAMLPESRERGYKPGRFSFNVSGGRCEACQGDGQRRIEMNFMPDVFVQCEVCNGRRYNQETLSVKFHGHSIADILELTIEDALPVLTDVPSVHQKLQTLVDVGLGYVKLGQSATTLSGGEAQRMKLARELSKRQTGRTLYLLDEPTTGLHFDDVRKLLEVLHRLVDLGNSVIIIEHNLDVIRNADWILDLGPEGGEEGGHVVGEGRPAEIAAMPGSFTGQFLRHYYTASDGRLEQVDLGDKAVLADYAAYESAESNLETEAKQEFVPRKKKTGVPEAIKSVPVKRAAAAKAKAPAAKKTAVKKAATRKKKTGTL